MEHILTMTNLKLKPSPFIPDPNADIQTEVFKMVKYILYELFQTEIKHLVYFVNFINRCDPRIYVTQHK